MNTASSPKLWPRPQWAVSCDRLDFGRVRPGASVELPVVVANAGGGAASLAVQLQSNVPWLQLRAGDGAPWSSQVALSLQSGEEVLLLCRADPTSQSDFGGQDALIEIWSEGGVANAPDASGSSSRVDLAPIKASAFFLEPRFLRLDAQDIVDASQTTSIKPAPPGGRCEVVVESKAVPLGIGPRVEFVLRRSDALPTHAELGLFSLKQGREQWFDCALNSRGDRQTLEIVFHTANRRPGETHTIELEVRDADDLVEAARLTWHLTVTRPPLLEFAPLEVRAVPRAITEAKLVLSNAGEGDLQIEWLRVPGECRSWMSLGRNVQTPFSVAAGATRAVDLGVSGQHLATGAHHGWIEVSCNHAGRRVVRRVPVIAVVPTHAIRVEMHEHDLQAVLTHGTATSLSLKLWNESASEVRLRAVAFDALDPVAIGGWIGCEPGRVNLTPGGSAEVLVSLRTADLPLPLKNAPVQREGVLSVLVVEPKGEAQVWNRKLSLRVQPRPKRFGLF
jgi:hypothetical protein